MKSITDAFSLPITFYRKVRVTKTHVGICVALVCVVVLLASYTTQLSPAITLRVVDTSEQGIAGVPGRSRGGFYAASFEEPVQSDVAGTVYVPARSASLSGWERLVAFAHSMRPHSGGLRPHSTAVHLDIPTGYEVDSDALGRDPTYDSGRALPRMESRRRIWNLPDGVWKLRYDEGLTGVQDYISVQTDNPSYSGRSNYTIVLRRKEEDD